MAKAITFKNDEEKKEAVIVALKRLKGSLGWRVICRGVQESIKITEEKLHGDREWEEGDSLKGLQDKRNDRTKFLALPEILMKEFDEAEDFPPNLDPYE